MGFDFSNNIQNDDTLDINLIQHGINFLNECIRKRNSSSEYMQYPELTTVEHDGKLYINKSYTIDSFKEEFSGWVPFLLEDVDAVICLYDHTRILVDGQNPHTLVSTQKIVDSYVSDECCKIYSFKHDSIENTFYPNKMYAYNTYPIYRITFNYTNLLNYLLLNMIIQNYLGNNALKQSIGINIVDAHYTIFDIQNTPDETLAFLKEIIKHPAGISHLFKCVHDESFLASIALHLFKHKKLSKSSLNTINKNIIGYNDTHNLYDIAHLILDMVKI